MIIDELVTPAGYSGTPLVRKLGIAADSRVRLIGAPRGFRTELAGLPAGARLTNRPADPVDLTIWFTHSRRELEGRIAAVAAAMGRGLWIAWPKKTSGVSTDVTGDLVRQTGLAHGLVDYKVCAINTVWSGLKFARRR
jgi:hypothetical protein